MRATKKETPTPVPVELNVSPRWFAAIQQQKKTIEGRLHRGKFKTPRQGDVFVFRRADRPNVVAIRIVSRRVRYPSFEEYLSQEGLARTLPGVKTISEGVRAYRCFYSEELERAHGVVAFHLECLS